MPISADYIEIRSLHDLYRCMEGKKKAIFRYIIVEGEPREDYVGEICKIEFEDGSYKSFNLGLNNQDGIRICYWHTKMISGEPRSARMAAEIISRSTETVEETNPFDFEEDLEIEAYDLVKPKVNEIEERRVTHDGFGNPY